MKWFSWINKIIKIKTIFNLSLLTDQEKKRRQKLKKIS